MPSNTLRWIILITAITLGVLVWAQLYWLNRIHDYERREFNTSVVKSIQGVYEDLDITNSATIQLRKLIEQPNANTFLFKIDSLPPRQVLVDEVLSNLEDFQVFTDCILSLYDPLTHKYLYNVYLPAAGSHRTSSGVARPPSYRKAYGYVRLYFPHRSQYIFTSMRWWIVSAVFLLLLLLALSLSIFYLYRQKFLNEIQNDFIQNVTHEFQTPLTTLAVGLDGLSKPFITQNQDKFELYVTLMQAQTEYLKHHIDNLMKVLKAEANGLVLDKGKVVPNELIKKAVAQLRAVADEKQATVTLLCEETNASIMADAGSLYVAILNLISNALKYAAKPAIVVETKVTGNTFYLCVKDNGIGIEEKFKKNLFKKFYRVPTGNVHFVKGLGLGLYFVKKVVTGHKGTITVISIPGKGSEFTIELPLV